MGLSGNYATILDSGKVRISNDDSVIANVNGEGDVILVVCDGMGGYKRGDFASKILIDTINENFVNHKKFFNRYSVASWLNKIIKDVNKTIFKYSSEREFKDMGTTIALAFISKKYIVIAHAGDSRVYFYDDKEMRQMTKDDTYVNYLLSLGELTEEEIAVHPKRHTLTNAIGIFPVPQVRFEMLPNEGQNIFICTDGVYNNLSEDEILMCLQTDELINEKLKTIVNLANKNGGSDNMAIAAWETSKNVRNR